MSPTDLNLNEVLQRSTSDVPLAELAKKGFRNVKVLNREAIHRLISEAVDRAITEQLARATDDDRAKIKEEARERFDDLLKEKRETDHRLQTYEEKIKRLETEIELRDAQLRELGAGANLPKSSPATAELRAIQDSIEKLTRRLASGASAASDVPLEGPEAEFAVKAMLSAVGETAVETNVEQVTVKKTKAGGVGGVLDKLKNLKKKEKQ